jgi:hypothetical protein
VNRIQLAHDRVLIIGILWVHWRIFQLLKTSWIGSITYQFFKAGFDLLLNYWIAVPIFYPAAVNIMPLTIVCFSSWGLSRSFWWRQPCDVADRCWSAERRHVFSPTLPWTIWCKCYSQYCAKWFCSCTACPPKSLRSETSRRMYNSYFTAPLCHNS